LASEPPGEDGALPVQRRDYYRVVWKQAKERTHERVFKSSASSLVTNAINGGIGLALGATVGPSVLSIPLAGDAVEKGVLALGGTVVFLAIRWAWAMGDELIGAPVAMWRDAQEEQHKITAERDAAQLARTSETAALQQRIDDLLTPAFQFFVDTPDEPPFLEDEPFRRDQTLVRVGLRTRGVKTIQNVKVRLVRALPSDVGVPAIQIDPEAILEIRGGTPVSGIDLDNGHDVHPQLLTVHSYASVPLPEVKVHYKEPNLASAYPSLPCGEWLLTLQATGTDVAPARRHFTLRVTDDLDRRKRAVLRMEPDEEEDG
jgi:hypothetical protein